MAVCMALQTLLFIGGAVAMFVAWRRTAIALADAKATADAQIAELRGHLDHMSHAVDEVSRAVLRGSTAVDGVMSDVRDAMGTVRSGVGSVASVVTGPRTALAVGLWRGIQFWRKRRAAQRLSSAMTSEL
jgi:hypothetical protein